MNVDKENNFFSVLIASAATRAGSLEASSLIKSDEKFLNYSVFYILKVGSAGTFRLVRLGNKHSGRSILYPLAALFLSLSQNWIGILATFPFVEL